MQASYKIEIELYPTETTRKDPLYFWSLMSSNGSEWRASMAGYEATPQKAFEKGYGYYEEMCEMNGGLTYDNRR